MTDILKTQNAPRFHVVKEMNEPNCVRAYRKSPEDIELQIRLENRYVRIALSFQETKQLINMLIGAVGAPS